MTRPLGVGILGAGPATQAIHLPTLARHPDLFRVITVMDIDAAVAGSVAANADAKAATQIEAVLEDPAIDVIAVCSPHHVHAAQVAAICAAGKQGILCEKPLATSQAELEQITGAVSAAGVPLIVGAMHTYDPGWLAALETSADYLDTAHTIRSTIVLPFNDRYEDLATEIAVRAPAPAPPGALDLAARANQMSGLVLGLFVHDLPLVRRFAPFLDQVDDADFIEPLGGVISLTAAGRHVDLISFMRPLWASDWRLEAWGQEWSMRISFTPSYVQAGSAIVAIRDRHGERRLGPFRSNGYEGEWLELHDLVTGAAEPRYSLSDIRDDQTFTTSVANGAAEAVLHRAA
jgi:myo-inositol 2-dehydrogenase/D-chiro-inositol 1-dehydrogenase